MTSKGEMKQRRIVFANRKGGCGKTSSSVNVATGLALANRKVLLVDCDAQAHATLSIGLSPYNIEYSLFDLLEGYISDIQKVIQPAKWPNGLHILPTTVQLAVYELENRNEPQERGKLASLLFSSVCADYDYIILDPPPTVGHLCVMCMVAAQEVIIPVQTHFLSMESLAEMVRFIYQINATVNPDLRISGIIPTFYSRKVKLAKDVIKDIRANFGPDIILPPVRYDISIAEAPGFGQSIFKHAPNTNGALDYASVVCKMDNDCKSFIINYLRQEKNNQKSRMHKKKRKKKKTVL